MVATNFMLNFNTVLLFIKGNLRRIFYYQLSIVFIVKHEQIVVSI